MSERQIEFHGGLIFRTDYFGSLDWNRGAAWLVVREKVWHVLLPGPPRSRQCVQAGPVPAEDEPGGWAWCVDIDGQRWVIPTRTIHGTRPEPPERGGIYQRAAVIYTGWAINAGRAAFGGVHDLRNGPESFSARICVCCGVRVAGQNVKRGVW